MARDGSKIEAMSFAAGTSASMVCIGRAVLVSLFVKWRVWVFLALNLLLLAILFTSKSHNNASLVPRKKRIPGFGSPATTTNDKVEMRNKEDEEEEKKDEEEEEEEEEEEDEVSNEELNQRVEAFIARFRQQLVSDASKNVV